jgi:hypothetical protein
VPGEGRSRAVGGYRDWRSGHDPPPPGWVGWEGALQCGV